MAKKILGFFAWGLAILAALALLIYLLCTRAWFMAALATYVVCWAVPFIIEVYNRLTDK